MLISIPSAVRARAGVRGETMRGARPMVAAGCPFPHVIDFWLWAQFFSHEVYRRVNRGVAAMTRLVFMILGAIVLGGCGGGGGETNTNTDTTTPADPDQAFDISILQSTTQGSVYASDLRGRDSTGVSYTGTIAVANRAQTLLNGLLVTPQDSLLTLSGGNLSVTITSTSYLDEIGNLISLSSQTSGLTCTPASPDRLPDIVRVGDFGILSALICTDNITLERSWRVESAGAGMVNVIVNGTEKDSRNRIVSITDSTTTIDTSGNVVRLKGVSTVLDNRFTLTYESL